MTSSESAFHMAMSHTRWIAELMRHMTFFGQVIQKADIEEVVAIIKKHEIMVAKYVEIIKNDSNLGTHSKDAYLNLILHDGKTPR